MEIQLKKKHDKTTTTTKKKKTNPTSKTKKILSANLFIKKRKSCTIISCACLLKQSLCKTNTTLRRHLSNTKLFKLRKYKGESASNSFR